MKTTMRSAAHRAPFLVMAVLLVFLAGGATRSAAANLDLVVMVDTSESMFPYFDDLMNYLVQDLLTTRLHRGDTFHLLSFSSVPEVEISLEINSETAAQQAFGRILLLHALGRYTDLVAALQFLDKYVKELPETNPKQIILITDGEHDPPPGSPNRGDPAAIQAAIQAAASDMGNKGWTFDILKVPPQPAPGDTSKSYLPDIAKAVGSPIVPYRASDKANMTGRTTGFPNLIFPPALGKVGNRFVASFKVKNWKDEPIIVSLSSVQSDGNELLDKKLRITVPPLGEGALDVPIHLPLSYPKGQHDTSVKLVFDDDLRISPTTGTLSFTYTGRGGIPMPRLTFLYILYIVLGLLVIYLLIRLYLFMRKKVGEAPLTGIARGQTLADENEESLGGLAPAHPAQAGPRAGPDRRVGRGGRERVALVEGSGAAHQAHLAASGHVHLADVSPGQRPAGARPAVRGKVPLLGTVDATAATVGARRVRPTVTSIKRAIPRAALQQSPSLPPLIEMRVSLQNHRIGFRNVHRVTAGSNRSVGGGFSAYAIFLVPVPANIGEIRNDDGRYVFTPLRSELFPDLTGPVEDCLDKEIPFVTPRGRELSLSFRRWVSSLEEVNRILRQTRS